MDDSRRDWQAWKDLLSAAGVRDFRVHDARHTLGTYSHVVPELFEDAADKIGGALWNRNGNPNGTLDDESRDA
jgi:integrase